MERQQRNTVSNTKTQTIFNKEFALFSRLRLQSSFSGGLVLLCLLAEKYNTQYISPEVDFAWQGGSWIPQATWSTQTLVLPTSSVTLNLQWKEQTMMLNLDRFLYGKA